MPLDVTDGRLADLNARFGDDAEGALRLALSGRLGRVALVSSFGAESAVLLHMAAQLDPDVPVIFIDTRMLFAETIAYQEALGRRLGLTNLRRVRPDPVDLARRDPDATLHRRDPDACCDLRKARVLACALSGYDGWLSGRKRFQNGLRSGLEVFERDPASGRIKINPLAGYGPEALRAYMDRHELPRHPLVARGYPSIGCAPCTSAVAPGEDVRAGRWRGLERTECGIHLEAGRIVRRAVGS